MDGVVKRSGVALAVVSQTKSEVLWRGIVRALAPFELLKNFLYMKSLGL